MSHPNMVVVVVGGAPRPPGMNKGLQSTHGGTSGEASNPFRTGMGAFVAPGCRDAFVKMICSRREIKSE